VSGHQAPAERSGAFHARAGWYFRRGEDGSVTIWPGEGEEITLDADSWASVVASVSAAGESSVTFALAKALHAGGEA
jgi:hypothetical protein